MLELIVARHAASRLTSEGVVNGDPNVADELTTEGIEQARLNLGRYLAGRDIDVCITSSFTRARQTAEVALGGRPVPYETDPLLDDMRFGNLEGTSLAGYRAWYSSNGPDVTVPGAAESRRDAIARYEAAFARISQRSEDTIVVVGHGLAVSYLLRAMADESLDGVIAPAGHASPHRLSSADVASALAKLRQWTTARQVTS